MIIKKGDTRIANTRGVIIRKVDTGVTIEKAVQMIKKAQKKTTAVPTRDG